GTVLLAGACRGIGAVTAYRLQDRRDLVLVGRDRDALDSVARSCRSARVVVADLTTAEGVDSAAGGLTSRDALVHCAGVADLGRIEESTPDQWRRAVDVNVLSVVALTRARLPAR